MQKSIVFYVYVIFWEQLGQAGAENGAMLTSPHIYSVILQNAQFVVKFSKFSSSQAARGHWPPNQNPVDVPGRYDLHSWWGIMYSAVVTVAVVDEIAF